MPLTFKTPNIIQLIELVTIAGAMVLGQFFFLNAMKGTETTFIAPFFYSTLVFVMILDLALFGVIPDIISLIGASLINIFIAVWLVALVEFVLIFVLGSSYCLFAWSALSRFLSACANRASAGISAFADFVSQRQSWGDGLDG